MSAVFIFNAGGITNDVMTADNEPVEFIVIDDDAWESNECPVCRSESVELVGAEKHYTENKGIAYYQGGHMECKDCGASSEMDSKELIATWQKFVAKEIHVNLT